MHTDVLFPLPTPFPRSRAACQGLDFSITSNTCSDRINPGHRWCWNQLVWDGIQLAIPHQPPSHREKVKQHYHPNSQSVITVSSGFPKANTFCTALLLLLEAPRVPIQQLCGQSNSCEQKVLNFLCLSLFMGMFYLFLDSLGNCPVATERKCLSFFLSFHFSFFFNAFLAFLRAPNQQHMTSLAHTEVMFSKVQRDHRWLSTAQGWAALGLSTAWTSPVPLHAAIPPQMLLAISVLFSVHTPT